MMFIVFLNMLVEGLYERCINGDKLNGGYLMDVEVQEKIFIGIYFFIFFVFVVIVEEEEDFKVVIVSYVDIVK